MKILAIETSCDDTAISIVEVKGTMKRPLFKVLAHNISSQTKIHEQWGGVVPSLAKREHGKNLVPLLVKSLKDAKLCDIQSRTIPKTLNLKPKTLLEREPELREQFLETIPTLKIPKIDAIAVTKGPGLEPALWVGINFAKALAQVWDKPLYPINHLEGHILASLGNLNNQFSISKINFPVISLIVSGGHTELVLSKDWLKYKIVGRTRDDAVGEAFDKVARILGLPYPGGPEISKLALLANLEVKPPSDGLLPLGGLTSKSNPIKLPRPMLHSGDLDFSFSGIKTAVLYMVQKLKAENKFTDEIKAEIAHDFQNAVIEVIIAKTLTAAKKFKAKTIIAGGGVIANSALRDSLNLQAKTHQLNLLIPELSYSTDNATMIALAAGFRLLAGKFTRLGGAKKSSSFKAEGNLNLK